MYRKSVSFKELYHCHSIPKRRIDGYQKKGLTDGSLQRLYCIVGAISNEGLAGTPTTNPSLGITTTLNTKIKLTLSVDLR